MARMRGGGGRGHLINPNAFSDSHATSTPSTPPAMATPSTSNFGAGPDEALPQGDPKYLQVGRKRNLGPGLTNQRFQYN